MQLDSVFYNEKVNMFVVCMERTFGKDIKKIETICKFESRGFFSIKYEYFPNDYTIVIENELRTFDITIYDAEQASTSLYHISKFKNQLNKECIQDAVILLKTVLEKNDFDMYFHKNGKFYRKNADGIKRVKDLKELLNG
jgi:hypothetical protein